MFHLAINLVGHLIIMVFFLHFPHASANVSVSLTCSDVIANMPLKQTNVSERKKSYVVLTHKSSHSIIGSSVVSTVDEVQTVSFVVTFNL
jgi:hypothetical protein